MEMQSRHSALSVISQVSAVEEYPLSGVPLYMIVFRISALATIIIIVFHQDTYNALNHVQINGCGSNIIDLIGATIVLC